MKKTNLRTINRYNFSKLHHIFTLASWFHPAEYRWVEFSSYSRFLKLKCNFSSERDETPFLFFTVFISLAVGSGKIDDIVCNTSEPEHCPTNICEHLHPYAGKKCIALARIQSVSVCVCVLVWNWFSAMVLVNVHCASLSIQSMQTCMRDYRSESVCMLKSAICA